MTKFTQLIEQFQSNLMAFPYATNDFASGVYRTSQKRALKMAYIQANEENSISKIVLDLDFDVIQMWLNNSLALTVPSPNLIVINPKNNHAHLLYLLKTPIHFNWNSSNKAIKFLADVERALIHLWGADTHFNGLLVKNPINSTWETLIGNDRVFDLNDFKPVLEQYQDQCAAASPKEETKVNTVLGRNCALFDSLRHWAYSEWSKADPNTWVQEVIKKGLEMNQELFTSPLGYTEVKATAKSIANFCIEKLTKEKSMAWNKLTRKKAQKVVAENKQKKIDAVMRLYVEGEVSMQDIADMLQVSRKSVHNYLKEGKEQERLRSEQPTLF